jgi:hypothetical protein
VPRACNHNDLDWLTVLKSHTGHQKLSDDLANGSSDAGRLAAATTNTTTKIGRGLDAIEVVHDRVRCHGYVSSTGRGCFQAWSSGDHFDDRPLGDFQSRAAAIAAITTIEAVE